MDYKLDLTQKVTATEFKPNQQGQLTAVKKEVPLSNIALDFLNRSRPGSFAKIEELNDLIEKSKSNAPFEVTKEQMKIIFRIFQRTEISIITAFSKMVESENKDFDSVEFEKELNVRVQ